MLYLKLLLVSAGIQAAASLSLYLSLTFSLTLSHSLRGRVVKGWKRRASVHSHSNGTAVHLCWTVVLQDHLHRPDHCRAADFIFIFILFFKKMRE